jgi:hypothetical protein
MLKVEISGDAQERIERARDHIQGWITTFTGDIAQEGSAFIKDRYLRGQALRRLTGETFGSVKQFYVKKTRTWYIRPGVGVRGSLNYLARWIGTDREFMQPGFDRFLATKDVELGMIKRLEKQL